MRGGAFDSDVKLETEDMESRDLSPSASGGDCPHSIGDNVRLIGQRRKGTIEPAGRISLSHSNRPKLFETPPIDQNLNTYVETASPFSSEPPLLYPHLR